MSKILILGFFMAMSPVARALDTGFDIAAAYDESVNVITISWKNEQQGTQQFILQKTDDGQYWTDLDTLYNDEALMGQEIRWEYRKPLPGGSYYRIKAIMDENNITCSKPVFVTVNPPLFEWRIAPDSKKDKLTLQYQGRGKIKGVINVVMQQSVAGKVLFRSRLASNTKTIDIPVGNLGKGSYDIQLYVEGALIWSQHFKKQTLGSGMICKLF